MPSCTLTYQPTSDPTKFGSRQRLVASLVEPLVKRLAGILNEMQDQEEFKPENIILRKAEFEPDDWNVPDLEFVVRIGPGPEEVFSKRRPELRAALRAAVKALVITLSPQFPSAAVNQIDVELVFDDAFGLTFTIADGETLAMWGRQHQKSP